MSRKKIKVLELREQKVGETLLKWVAKLAIVHITDTRRARSGLQRINLISPGCRSGSLKRRDGS